MKKANPIKKSISRNQNIKAKDKSNQSSVTVHNLQIKPNKNIGIKLGLKK